MMHRILVALGAVAMLVVLGTAETQAARYRGSACQSSRSAYTQPRRSVVKPCAYPRVRQINGKTLWDLGKQEGQWPTLP